MKATILKKEAMTQTYLDVENLIYDIVWKFIRQYGGDFDELAAQANYIYIEAYNSYDDKVSKFSTWLHFCIWNGLIDFVNFLKEKNRYGRIFLLEEIEDFKENLFHSTNELVDLLDEVGLDSNTIIGLVLDLPNDLQKSILKRGSHSQNVRIPLRQYLSSKLGWTGRQIKESFDEIREAVSA